MNIISLMGRLTENPELKTTQNGVSVTSFTLAVERGYTPKGQERQTDFINCVAWRQTAEFVTKYFCKGQRVALNGSLQSRKYTDKDGNNRVAFEVVADQVYFADGKKDNGNAGQTSSTNYDTSSYTGEFANVDDDDDLPF